MTLSSELFLTPTYTAPQGSSRDGLLASKSFASNSTNNGPQNIDKPPLNQPNDNSNDRFKDHLAQETDTRKTAKDSGQVETDSNTIKASKENSEETTSISTQGENIPANVEKNTPPAGLVYNENRDLTLKYAKMPAKMPNGNQIENALPSKQDSVAQGKSGEAVNIKQSLQNNMAQSNITKTEVNIAEVSKAQSTENTGKILETAAKIAAANTPQATSLEKNSATTLPNPVQNNPLLPAVNMEDISKAKPSTDTLSKGAIGQTSTLSPKQDNALSGQNISDADVTLVQKTETQKPEIQKLGGQTINSQNSAVQAGATDIAGVISGVISGDLPKDLTGTQSVNAAQVNSENSKAQSGTPQQYIAAAPIQATNQRPAEPLKDSVKTSLKGAGNAQASEGSENKNQAASSENIANAKSNGSSKNSAENQYSSQNSSSAGPASLANGQSINNQMGSVPFQTELNTAMTKGDVGSPLLNSPSLQATLLSVQEIGQQNNLAPTSHIKPPTLPVTPQMVTKQISMAILKQAANGLNSFKLSLKPAELGQVNIRMDFQADGKVITSVIVDNDRTLALLQRDQGALSRALENAGFNTGGNDLNFTLKKQQHDQNQSKFSENNTGDGENDDLHNNLDNIISRQQLKMAYSDNALDINI